VTPAGDGHRRPTDAPAPHRRRPVPDDERARWETRLQRVGLRSPLPEASLEYLLPLLIFAEHEGEGLIHSFRYAFAGLWYALRTQRNLRIHLTAATIVVLLGVLCQVSPVEWAILALTIGAVAISELFNTVVEALVNLISPERHPLAKVAKDVAAAAVLCMAIMAVAVGLAVFAPRLVSLISWLFALLTKGL